MLRTLLLDPLTIKELSGVARRWQGYVSRMLYVALIGVVVFVFWMQIGRDASYVSPSETAQMGRILFYSFGGLQMVFVTLAAVSAASDLVTREVRGGTLGLLSLTPLSPWRIAAGKWKAAMAQAGMVILCGVPALAVCVFLGGVGAWEFLWCTSLSAASAALGAGISILFSSFVRAGTVAILLSLVVLFLYNLLPGILAASLAWREGEEFLTLLLWVHAHYSFVGAASSMEVGGMFGSAYAWIGATGATFLGVALLVYLTSLRVDVLLKSHGGPSLLARTFEAIDQFASDASPRRLRKVWNVAGAGPVWERNAILWKELRTRAAGKIRNATRLGFGIVLLFLLPLSCLMTEGRNWEEPLLWMSAVLLLFMAMANGAGLFVEEKEEKRWDVLLSTPLTARQLIAAKLLAGAVPLLPVTILLGGIYTVLALAQGAFPGPWAVAGTAILLMVAFAYVLGAWASLGAQNLRSAFSLTFGIVLGTFVVVPLLALLLTAIVDARTDWDELPLVLVKATNPLPYIVPFSSAVGSSGYYEYRNSWARNEYLRIVGYFPVYIAVYGGLSVWLLVAMRMGFRRVTGRS